MELIFQYRPPKLKSPRCGLSDVCGHIGNVDRGVNKSSDQPRLRSGCQHGASTATARICCCCASDVALKPCFAPTTVCTVDAHTPTTVTPTPRFTPTTCPARLTPTTDQRAVATRLTLTRRFLVLTLSSPAPNRCRCLSLKWSWSKLEFGVPEPPPQKKRKHMALQTSQLDKTCSSVH